MWTIYCTWVHMGLSHTVSCLVHIKTVQAWRSSITVCPEVVYITETIMFCFCLNENNSLKWLVYSCYLIRSHFERIKVTLKCDSVYALFSNYRLVKNVIPKREIIRLQNICCEDIWSKTGKSLTPAGSMVVLHVNCRFAVMRWKTNNTPETVQLKC